jgi:alkylated DNA repair dioxygenase AlkB
MEPPYRYWSQFADDPDGIYAHLVAGLRWDERMRARKTASLGLPYNYSGMTYPTADWPPLTKALRDRVGERCGFRPDNCLLNWYETGQQTMGFHSDDARDLAPGTGIAILSVGAARILRFRPSAPARRSGFVDRLLEPGSLLWMSAEMQADWQHAIPPAPGAGGRISLTFRQLK